MIQFLSLFLMILSIVTSSIQTWHQPEQLNTPIATAFGTCTTDSSRNKLYYFGGHTKNINNTNTNHNNNSIIYNSNTYQFNFNTLNWQNITKIPIAGEPGEGYFGTRCIGIF